MKIYKINNFTSKKFFNKKTKLNQIFNRKLITSKTREKEVPFVTLPLIAYASLKGIRDTNNSSNCTKAINKQKELFNNGTIDKNEYNQRVKEIKNYYNEADKLPDKVSSSQIKRNEPQFRGSPDNTDLQDDTISPELQADLDEIEDLVPELDPELKEVLYAPPIDTPEGLIETIFGELPEGADIDWDLWDLLKEMADEILDFGDIF